MRYMIKNAIGLYYNESEVVDTVAVIKENVAVLEARIAPLFEVAHQRWALKFETEQDAQYMLTHPQLKDPAAFAGCTIETTEN